MNALLVRAFLLSFFSLSYMCTSFLLVVYVRLSFYSLSPPPTHVGHLFFPLLFSFSSRLFSLCVFFLVVSLHPRFILCLLSSPWISLCLLSSPSICPLFSLLSLCVHPDINGVRFLNKKGAIPGREINFLLTSYSRAL
jgi:hypothetical protein